jgi:hypothetical protein
MVRGPDESAAPRWAGQTAETVVSRTVCDGVQNRKRKNDIYAGSGAEVSPSVTCPASVVDVDEGSGAGDVGDGDGGGEGDGTAVGPPLHPEVTIRKRMAPLRLIIRTLSPWAELPPYLLIDAARRAFERRIPDVDRSLAGLSSAP